MLKSALIIDEMAVEAGEFANVLSELSISSHIAQSLDAALVRMDTVLPDCVFIDENIAGGVAVAAKEIAQASSRPPIFVLSDSAGLAHIESLRAQGAEDVLVRPVNSSTLKQVLRPWMQKKATPSSVGAGPSSTAQSSIAARPVPKETSLGPAEIMRRPKPQENWRELEREQRTVKTPTSLRFYRLVAVAFVALSAWVAWDYWQGMEQARKWRNAIQFAHNRAEPLRWEEVPFASQQSSRVTYLVRQILENGFEGHIEVSQHLGRFCLMDMGNDIWRLPARNLLTSNCSQIRVPPRAMSPEATRAQESFERELQQLPFLTGSQATVEVVSRGPADTLFEYPSEDNVVTVGEWNTIAQRNHRLTIHLVPAQ